MTAVIHQSLPKVWAIKGRCYLDNSDASRRILYQPHLYFVTDVALETLEQIYRNTGKEKGDIKR